MSNERAAIEEAIPHRDPFLLLDRVKGETETSLDSEWTVPADADWIRGHYPRRPITPGVLISEHVFQTAAVFVSRRSGGLSPGDGVPVLTRIKDARFRRIVEPGETLCTHVELEDRVGPAWYLTGRVACGGETVLKIRFVLSATAAMARLGG